MIRTLQQVLVEAQLSDGELTAWIEQRWVLPTQENGDYIFDDADVARVHFICELRRDLQVNEEAIPVVLSLLDQVYALRRTLGELTDAINDVSEDARAQIADRLARDRRP